MRLRTSRCPCRRGLGTLQQVYLETGLMSRHFIAEISPNAALNYTKPNHGEGDRPWYAGNDFYVFSFKKSEKQDTNGRFYRTK